MTDTLRMIVCGGGGIGSWLAEELVRMLEFQRPGSMLVIVDGDNYEPKNKERQNLSGAGNKAEILAGKLQPEFDSTYVIPIPQWIVGEDAVVDENPEDLEADGSKPAGKIKATELIADGDVIYAVVDNFKCRKDIVDAAAKLDNVDVFLAGNDDALFGTVYHYRRRDGQDITEHPAERMDEIRNPPDRNPGEMSCAERAALEGGSQVVAVNMGVAAYLGARTHKTIINGYNDELTESDIYFDLGNGMSQSYDRRVEVPDLVTA